MSSSTLSSNKLPDPATAHVSPGSSQPKPTVALGLFVVKALLILALTMAFPIIIASQATHYVKRPEQKFNNTRTESNLLIMPRKRHVDVVLLGTSHARNFARENNHKRVEKILDKQVLNLGIGEGGGVVPTVMFMELFYERRKNSADTVIYFLDPWVLYSPMWNEHNRFGKREPFYFPLLFKMLSHGFDAISIRHYLKSKLDDEWLSTTAEVDEESIDTVVVPEQLKKRHARIDNLYPDGTRQRYRKYYQAQLVELIKLCQLHGSRLVLIKSPTLLEEEPGAGALARLFKQLEKQYGIETYDYTHIYSDLSLFEDLDHLNTNGVERFTADYLKPIVENNAASSKY